jgi:hypothetical protein
MTWRDGAAMFCLAALPWAQTAQAAPPHKIDCPAAAPADWGVGGAALSGVEILSQPKGEPIDETAPPSLMPDQTKISGGTLRQSWTMNEDGPGFDFFVDCHYAGTKRLLRIKATGVKRCDRMITHYRSSGAPDPRSVDSLHCD